MDEEYILRWNDHGVSFFALAEDLLQQELLTDVTIWCGDRVFDAHRLVLCACSPLFKAMLTRQPSRLRRPPDQPPIVFLKDISPVHFERLLQFMYCGEVRVPNNELEDLLAAATSLSVRGLANAQERCNNNSTEARTQTVPLVNPFLPTPASEVETVAKVQNANPAPPPPAPPPKKRRLSRSAEDHVRKSPLSPLDNNRLMKTNNSTGIAHLPSSAHISSRGSSAIKEEDEPVSPPPQAELVPLIEPNSLKTTSASILAAAAVAAAASSAAALATHPPRISETQRILPPSEPRKTGTCYFCKKSFMKNKQLMNHVCPKKPRSSSGGSQNSSSPSTTYSKAASSSPPT